jgi:hypothetical protein
MSQCSETSSTLGTHTERIHLEFVLSMTDFIRDMLDISLKLLAWLLMIVVKVCPGGCRLLTCFIKFEPGTSQGLSTQPCFRFLCSIKLSHYLAAEDLGRGVCGACYISDVSDQSNIWLRHPLQQPTTQSIG